MSSIDAAAPAAAGPVVKLRPRSVNTCATKAPGIKTAPLAPAGGSLSVNSSTAAPAMRAHVACVAANPAQPGARLRGSSATSSSTTRRMMRTAKPPIPDRPHAPAVGDAAAPVRRLNSGRAASAHYTATTTSTSHLGDSGRPAPRSGVTSCRTSARGPRPVETPTSAAAPAFAGHPHGAGSRRRSGSRMDSVCSSDKDSVHRAQRPPTAPRPAPLASNAPMVRSATADCAPVRRTATAASVTAVGSVPASQLCSRTPSVHDMVVPPTPRRAMVPTPRSIRPYASAPASRVSSVNSRLGEGMMRLAPRPQTSSVRLIVTKRSSNAAAATAAAAAAEPTAAGVSDVPPVASAAPVVVDQASAAPAEPLTRQTNARPLLSTNRVAVASAAVTKVGGAPRVRALYPSSQPPQRTDRAGGRSARGGCTSGFAGGSRNHSLSAATCTSARGGASRSTSVRQPAVTVPLSTRCATSVLSPSKKPARKLRSSSAGGPTSTAATAAAPPAPFQQTHTGCPPPLSFAGVVRGPASVPAKGPVSPIKRTATACPSAAVRYPAAAMATASEEPARRSEGQPTSPMPDFAFAHPWIKPGTLSTPTNHDGARDASEAPTIPYEGSTGLRPSMSLSPRTDFDSHSVCGRLSYGM